jgi:hypothetical protein
MTAIDYSSQVMNSAAQVPAAAASAKKADLLDFSFADLLDIVNPLQHIPVVSTLYRSITGDRMGTPEKIAGDTLYGGVIGLFASLADTAFKEITGKDVGDTVLAFLTGDDATAPTQTAAASEKPAQVTPAQAVGAPDLSALMSALSGKGVDAGTAARAAYAYRFTTGLTATAPLLPPV